MSMLKDETTILKGMMMQLNEEAAVLVTLQYHTERNEFSKVDRSKSKYRWFARIFKLEDLKKKIAWLLDDANRLNKFKWPNDPWPWYVSATYPENYKIASFLATKLKKMKSWEDGQKQLDGWQTGTKKRIADYNPTAKYATEGYQDESGNLVSLKDKDKLISLVGQNLIKLGNKP